MSGYTGPFSRYSEYHQFVVGVALGVAGREADEVLVAAVAAALGDSHGVPRRVLGELEMQPHYLAGGFVAGRLLHWWRHDG
jgi:hypothetical protein